MKPAVAEAVVPRLALRGLQASFLAGLRGEAAEELAESGAFLAPPRGSSEERWEVYREGYVIRLIEAIRNDYPALSRIVGPVAFGSLVRRYLRAFPPSSHDIGRAGNRLALYLLGDPLLAKLPFLTDLASFEAALAAAVIAADFAPVAAERLAALDPDGLLDLEISLAPGAAVLVSEWPLGDLWSCRDKPDEEISIEVLGRPTKLVIYRDGLAVRWRELSGKEADFLAAAERGTTLATLADGGSFGPPEEAARHLVPLFVRMIQAGILRIPIPETPQGISPNNKE